MPFTPPAPDTLVDSGFTPPSPNSLVTEAPAPSTFAPYAGAGEMADVPGGFQPPQLPRAGFTPQPSDNEPLVSNAETPLGHILEGVSKGSARKAGAIMVNAAASAVEGMANPMTPAIISAAAVAPEVVVPLLTAQMAKSGSTKLAEGITALEQGNDTEGVTKVGEATTELLFAAAPALKPGAFAGEAETLAPRTTEALKATGAELLKPGAPIEPAKVVPPEPSALIQEPAPAPEAAPTKLEQDIATYDALRQQFTELAKTKGPASPEFQAVFQRIEDLKNEYGGNVPGKPAPPEAPAAEPPTGTLTPKEQAAARAQLAEEVPAAQPVEAPAPAEAPAPVPEAPKPAPTTEPPAPPAGAAPVEASPVAEPTVPDINLRESESNQLGLGKIKANDPQRWANIVKFFAVGDKPAAIAKAAQERLADIKARTVPEPPKADVGKPDKPTPPGATRYGMMMPGTEMILGDIPGVGVVSPTAEPFWNTERTFSEHVSNAASWIRDLWRGFALKQAPRITDSDRIAGESGVRLASAPFVGRAKGLEFAANVLRDTGVDAKKFGTALSEDNLRHIKDRWGEEAAAAVAKGDLIGAAAAQDREAAVRTLIGANRSPFATEADYQAFLADPNVQTAIARHIQLWREQKDPLFRKANDLDPDVPLAGRGRQTGARINLKALAPDEKGVETVGGQPSKLRQLATKLRLDPFARRATGAGQAYEGDYNELMAHGFGVEYPIAAQHEFIKALIEAGDAKVTDREFPPDLTIKGEKPVANVLRLNPWRGKFLQVRSSLVGEYRAISGLDETTKIPVLSAFNDVMTKQSVKGFTEGSTHVGNLMMEVFTGLGPTNNPLLNMLIKTFSGRADLLYRIPRVIIKAFQDTKPEMLRLAEAGMAKEPYQGKLLAPLLNGTDRGVRLVSGQLYDGMAEKGWVENTETGKREFINQVGNYNKRLQPWLIRKLRDTGIQPFATAAQAFNVMGLRRMVMAPGAKATSNMAALALRADIAGGFLGFVTLTVMLNKLLSGSTTGPKGTPLGAVGWTGDDGKVHSFNIGRLLGYDRGPRITGISAYMEARKAGLTHEQGLQAMTRAQASTGLSYFAGPGPRALYTAATGMRMTQPTVREAPAVAPTDSLNPFKTQMAKNIQTALIEGNPALSSLHDLHEGKGLADVAEKQLSRYTPRTGKTEQFTSALPRIVTHNQLIDYADGIVTEARKLALSERMDYIHQRFEQDGLQAQHRKVVMTEIKRKGALKYK